MMHSYRVWSRGPKIEVVKIGFDWAGFLFGVGYLLFRRLWFKAFVIFTMSFGISVMNIVLMEKLHQSMELFHILNGVMQICVAIFIGHRVHTWRTSSWGFLSTTIVKAKNKKMAIWRAARHRTLERHGNIPCLTT
jgi:hypothetical protein